MALNGIFIVGTGRSGTHFTTRLLNGFSKAHDPLSGKENSRLLMQITVAAISHREQPAVASSYYALQLSKLNGKVFLDQHHPNLFFVEKLARDFPDALFLYPSRPVVQVVGSMIVHPGVLSWYRFASQTSVPFPNRFLGLDNKEELNSLPLHILCAKRVLAHEQEFQRCISRYPGRVRAVAYEELVKDPTGTIASIFSAEEKAVLGDFVLTERSQPASLLKYRDVLSVRQLEEIESLRDQPAEQGP